MAVCPLWNNITTVAAGGIHAYIYIALMSKGYVLLGRNSLYLADTHVPVTYSPTLVIVVSVRFVGFLCHTARYSCCICQAEIASTFRGQTFTEKANNTAIKSFFNPFTIYLCEKSLYVS